MALWQVTSTQPWPMRKLRLQVWEAHKHLNEGIASGEVHPLPWTVYSRDRAQEAFRFLAGGEITRMSAPHRTCSCACQHVSLSAA